MFRLFALAGVLAVAVVVSGAAVQAQDDKTPTTKEIMAKLHKGKGSLRGKGQGEHKGKKWDDAAENVKTWVTLATALAKNEAKKGEKDSWKKLTEGYEKAVKSLAEAVEKKDTKAAAAAFKTTGDCMTCHKA